MKGALAHQFTASGASSQRRAYTLAPIAPPAKDAKTCRWCGARLIFPLPEWPYCQYGCAANDRAPYLRTCDECHRDFETGQHGAIFCYGCNTRLLQRLLAAEGPPFVWTAQIAQENAAHDRAEAGDRWAQLRRLMRGVCWFWIRHPEKRRPRP